MDEQSIFLEALEKTSPEDVAAWLDASCGEDRQLRQRVEALLMRSLGEVPEEVKLLKQLSELSTQRDESTSDEQRASLTEQMEKKAVRLSVLLERGGRNLSARAILERYRR